MGLVVDHLAHLTLYPGAWACRSFGDALRPTCTVIPSRLWIGPVAVSTGTLHPPPRFQTMRPHPALLAIAAMLSVSCNDPPPPGPASSASAATASATTPPPTASAAATDPS